MEILFNCNLFKNYFFFAIEINEFNLYRYGLWINWIESYFNNLFFNNLFNYMLLNQLSSLFKNEALIVLYFDGIQF